MQVWHSQELTDRQSCEHAVSKRITCKRGGEGVWGKESFRL